MLISDMSAVDVRREKVGLRHFMEALRDKSQGGDNILNISLRVSFYDHTQEECHLNYILGDVSGDVLFDGLEARLSLLDLLEKQIIAKEEGTA